MIRSELIRILNRSIEARYGAQAGAEFSVEEPGAGISADAATNLAFIISKKEKSKPADIAKLIQESVMDREVIDRLDISKNGFINIYLNDQFLFGLLSKILREDDALGKDPAKQTRRIMIEFVSANPTGPLHIGHGRGAALGNSLAHIYQQLGYSVTSEYYVNDAGVQMAMLRDSVAAQYQELAGQAAAVIPENGYRGAYITEIAKKMQSDQRLDFDVFPREELLNSIRQDLIQFGVPFDVWSYESDLYKQGKVEAAIAGLSERGRLLEKEGALWFSSDCMQTEDENMDKDRVLRKSNGNYTYFASDIAYHQDKFERGFERCIDIWGHDHHGYVPRVKGAVQSLGYSLDRLEIILYQLVSLKRGGERVAMSTRSGTFVTLKEILDEVGADACRFFFAMRSPSSPLDFDVDLAKKRSNENPVFYVQYVHARICSIFREAEKQKFMSSGETVSWQDQGLTLAPEERELLVKLGFFTDTLEACVRLVSPNLLATYLLDLANRFHKFYDRHRVLEADPKVRAFRLELLQGVQIIVRLGLKLLGVSAPETM